MKNLNMLERSERRQGFSGDRQEGGVSPSENVAFVDSEERNEDIAQVGDRHLRQISCLSQYLNEIGQIPRLSVSEEQQVAREVRSGSEEARERMINGNLRLVVKIAHDFEGYGMPVSDLINEGNIGLMKAVEHFDPERGVRFSTYSAYWIKQSIKRCLSNQSRTVRIPIHMVEKISKLNKVSHRFKEQFNRLPDEHELASELEMDPPEVRAIQRAQTRSVSLDSPLDEGRVETLEDRLPDESAPSPYAQLELQTSISRMCQMLDQLQERDSTILKERFGLEGDDPKTLEEVGQEFGVTRERIRQLQKEALVKLRNLMDDWVY
jgi:RNA polymerase primary sigma factor